MGDREQHAGSPPPKIGNPTKVSDEHGSAPVVPGISPYTSNTAVVNGVVKDDRERSGPVIPSPGEQNSAIVTGRGVKTFPIPNEPAPTPIPTDSPAKFSITVTDTPKQDDWETGKQGIAFVCVSTGDRGSKDYIEKCTAGEEMVKCLRDKLGYHTICVGTNWNMTSGELEQVLTEIEQSTLPSSYRRAFFYFFGHGNATHVKTADGDYKRHDIVARFQSISPPGSNVFKTIIFECCRKYEEYPITCEASQETEVKALSFHYYSKAGGTYPMEKNTLLIDTTNFDNEAHYLTKSGCGLFTKHFTRLAPTVNVSFNELLVKVRAAVVAESTPERVPKEQFVDFKDMLMGSFYLLAESQGTARVVATSVSVDPKALTTAIKWQVEGKIPDDLLRYDVEISPGTPHDQVSEVDTSARHATFTCLGSAMDHSARVVAVYKDGTRAISETKQFKTPEVKLANIQSPPTLTGFREGDTLRAEYTVQLSYEPLQDSELKKDHFTVTATPTTPDPERGGEDTVTMPCKERSIKLELELDTTYSLSVSTCYTDQDGNNSRNFPSKEEPTITTPDKAKVCRTFCCRYSAVYGILLLLITISLFLCGSFGAYEIILYRHSQCKTNYILTSDSVECGEANSLQYTKITIEGVKNRGDEPLGTMQAWRVKDIKFYSELRKPVIDGGPVTDREQVLLNGWQTYTWKGSVIYGYCCITNNGSTTEDASLYIFITDTDANNFTHGHGASNTVLSDTLTIPPGRQECFRKWGTDAPYTVTHNSYHFIGVDVPPESSYSSNITVLQMSVNTSNLGPPNYFKDAKTEVTLSKHPFSRNDYVIVCEAPPGPPLTSKYQSEIEPLNASMVGSDSLHLKSCKKPYHWMTIAFPISLAVGILFLFAGITYCIVAWVCMCRYHRLLRITCRGPYNRF